jgi:glycosyltransferase involved in cell wall biosynthesis
MTGVRPQGRNDNAAMRIVQFMASQQFGGAEKVFVELSNALAERFDVIALLLRDTDYRERFSPKVRQMVLKAHPTRYNPLLQVELFNVLRQLQPDLIHSHAVKGTELVRNVNQFLRMPHVGTKHNDRKGKVFNTLPWVTAVSSAAKNSVHPQRDAEVRVIYNGVQEEPTIGNGPPEIFTLLAVGRLDPIKGFDVLLHEVAMLPFPFRVRIVGEGPQHSTLVQLASSLNLADRVQFLGFRDDVPQLMKNSHLVVISSHREGCPKVLLEAMFYAPMLVSTPVGGSAEVLSDTLLTTQTRLGEKIQDVFSNYSFYMQHFRAVCEQKRTMFLFEKIVEQYVELYKEMLGVH